MAVLRRSFRCLSRRRRHPAAWLARREARHPGQVSVRARSRFALPARGVDSGRKEGQVSS
jgi:hypothetical protein